MNVDTDTTVSYTIKKVNIINLMLTKSQDKLLITAPYQWLDNTGKIIKSGCNMYKEADLTALGDQKDTVITILKSLIPVEGKNGNCNIMLGNTVTGFTARKGYMGAEKWESEKLTEEQLLNAIAPLTKQNVIDMVASFTASVFA